MTDRELLELAAKAAGFDGLWKDVIRSRIAEFKTIKYTKHAGFFVLGKEWNPLTDDGDALRLAVTLQLAVEFNKRRGAARAISNMDNSFAKESWCNSDKTTDPYAATRRAIVRAAVEIGKLKGENES